MATLGGKNGCRLQGTGRLLDWSKNNRKARHWDFDYWQPNSTFSQIYVVGHWENYVYGALGKVLNPNLSNL